MLKTIQMLRRATPILGLSLLPTLLVAESVPVSRPPRPGHVRPPLHINLTPATSYSYTPGQIRHAYGFDQVAASGANQKIAIIDAYGNHQIQSDLNTFCTQYGLSSTTIQILGNNVGTDAGWALETALDIEWAHAIAPNATLILSVAASSGLLDLLNAVDAAVNAGATVVSMSWGGPEFSGMSSYDTHFNRAGVTFTASSGDGGAGVEWPAVSPYVIGTGGTSLYLDVNSNRTSEVAWSGSGGGPSHYYPVPSFQSGWQTSSGRGVPDVSLVADPNTGVRVYDAVNGGWIVVGGTSAAAPQWAGAIALANELRAKVGATTLTSPNSSLYSLGRGSSTTPYSVNPTYYYDVSQGSNGTYTAAPPYDFVDGLGSPVGNTLVPALAPGALAPAAPTGVSAIATNGEIDLQWNATVGATSYNVKRGTVSGGPYSTIVYERTATSFRDLSDTLVPGTNYYYVVNAVNSSGVSPNSAQVSAMLPISPYVPPAPTNLQAMPISTSQITLTWTMNANDVTGFKLEIEPPGRSFYQFETVSASRTNYTVSGLAAQANYSFRVRAYNAYGNSPFSNTCTATTY